MRDAWQRSRERSLSEVKKKDPSQKVGLGAVRQTGTAVTKTAVTKTAVTKTAVTKTAAKNNFEGSDGRVPAVTPVDGRRRVQSWDMINAIREIPEELMGVRGRRKFKQGKGYDDEAKLAILGTLESILADLYWRPVNPSTGYPSPSVSASLSDL
ncbi:hypothetical protein B0H17DRAFT_1129177 [Mycena rosella]|uniref:Uncharacterized protein n=1 Tax=Mycena rosella TaxID=1033263 RepID=A0AAD7DVX8_MYCRO|nr:hypothetical protein B0H17DRAFT_1129177 [Mycena rosella]